MAKQMEQFDSWLNEIKKPKWNHREVCIAEDVWKAALEWALSIGFQDRYEQTFVSGQAIIKELGND